MRSFANRAATVLVAGTFLAVLGATAPATASAAPVQTVSVAAAGCAAKANAAAGAAQGIMPAGFNDCIEFPGGRVTKPGWSSCLSKFGTWRWSECKQSYYYGRNYIVYKKGSPKPAACV